MAKNIMIQGTMSHAGKSLLCAGLCRVLKQDGIRVAPFKSQNMALNSYITADGGEMGRAQAVQAEAAGILPDTRMNPILLKPVTDTGSQVIVNGRVLGNLSAREYFRRKRELIPQILDAYASLSAEYDVIVLEGAGSPVELNLKQDDIVNMGLAELVDAPVLLVGDIDRGGVFAQLYGTIALLEPQERRRVKGVVVNKFRGDRAILEPGLRQLEELCGVPVAGVLPWLSVSIDEEDSLAVPSGAAAHSTRQRTRRGTGQGQGTGQGTRQSARRVAGQSTGQGTGQGAEQETDQNPEESTIEIAVIRLPRISNFTDFAPFAHRAVVSLRYVDRVSDLGEPDLLFLPGTKSTLADLLWLRESGLETAVKRLALSGVPVFGICGGLQMLGRRIVDPEGVETAVQTAAGEMAAGEVRAVEGMGLLDMETVFRGEKTQLQRRGVFRDVAGLFRGLNGLSYTGYEIHHGQSGSDVLNEDCSGAVVQRGNVYGSYIHGLFDAPGVSDAVLAALRERRGLAPAQSDRFDLSAFREQQYNLLADAVRAGMDMELIYRLIGG